VLLTLCVGIAVADLKFLQSSYYGCTTTYYLGYCQTCYTSSSSYSYYYIYEQNGAYYYLNGTSEVCDIYSNNTSEGIPIPRSNECPYNDPCSITYDSSYRFDALTVSTVQPPLKMTSLYGDYDYQIIGELQQNSVSVYSPQLQQLVFTSSSGDRLHFIKKLSLTQFVTNFGIYDIGKQYTVSDFTFTYQSYQSETLPSIPPFNPPTKPTSGVAAFLSPFSSIEVTDPSKSFLVQYFPFEVILYGKNAQTDFQGITLSNPFFGFTNMEFYPPYADDDEGTFVFQLQSDSDYRAVPCEYGSSSSFEAYGFEVSFSLDFSGFSLSFSLEEFDFRNNKHASADSMAFNLF